MDKTPSKEEIQAEHDRVQAINDETAKDYLRFVVCSVSDSFCLTVDDILVDITEPREGSNFSFATVTADYNKGLDMDQYPFLMDEVSKAFLNLAVRGGPCARFKVKGV